MTRKKEKTKPSFFHFDRYLFLLSLISVGFVASVARYALRTYLVPEWDEQHYMYMLAGFYRLLQHPSFSIPYDALQLVPVRQPGYPLMILPFVLIFGLSYGVLSCLLLWKELNV